MSTDKLESLLKSLPEIAKVVNTFSSTELQAKAFDALMKAAGIESALVGAAQSIPPGGSAGPSRSRKPNKGGSTSGAPSSPRKRGGDNYELVNDLDFRPKGKPALKEFMAQKSPQKDPEKYAAVIFYLRHHLNVTDVTVNHIYSAFKALEWKVPNIRQGLNNTRLRKGWVEYEGASPISLTRIGENYVEHDLPQKPEQR